MRGGDRKLSPATVLGIGAVTPLGRDLADIAKHLEAAPPAGSGLRRVSDDLLTDPSLTRSMRRADRFVRMATFAASDAWMRAACAGISMDRVGLIVTSGLGPHCRGFKFLDGILDCGDSDALPTDFSHSVHGAAASYIAGLLDLRGPSLTATDFEIGFEQAILLAQCWLDQGICERVVVGAVEELGETLIQIAARILGPDKSFALGEGAVFLALGPGDISGIARIDAAAKPGEVDLLIRDEPAISPGGEAAINISAKSTMTVTPYFGQCAASSAFNVLGGLLSLAARRPLGKVLNSSGPVVVDNGTTLRTSCGQAVTLLLTRI